MSSNFARLGVQAASFAFAGALLYRAFRARAPQTSNDLFLGIDSSTQSLKALVIDTARSVVCEAVVNFARDLPHYGTTDGYVRGTDASGGAEGLLEVTAPSLMFVEALELALERLEQHGLDFGRIAAVSVSGQQHGSVWWARGAADTLRRMSAEDADANANADADSEPLSGVSKGAATNATSSNAAAAKARLNMHETLRASFSLPSAPIWMDSSTARECREIEAEAGGAARVAALSGSRTYERFTGPQIRKRMRTQPSVYAHTERISLVSSFIPTLLLGRYAPIDYSDGSGMNLLDLATGDWSAELLAATVAGTPNAHAGSADELRAKLGGAPVPSHQQVGTVGAHLRRRFGFGARCAVIAGSGDNPCAFAGLGLSRAGDIGVSLGTSDTVFAAVARAHPGLEGHVFRNPVDPASCMAMICFKNGALARQRVRDLSLPWSHPVAGTRLRDIGGAAGSSKTGGSGAGSATDGIATSTGAVNGAPSWKAFDRALSAESAPGNGGRLALFYFEPEITPTLNRAVIAHARTHFAGAGAAAVAAAEHATPAVLDEASLRVQPASEAVAAICCSGELQSSQGSQGSQSAGADNAWSAAAECRAIVESQALAMRVHSRRLGLEQPTRVIATGGASQNAAVLQVIADVFGTTVYRSAGGTESAALGAALRAAHGLVCARNAGAFVGFAEALASLPPPPSASTSSTASSSPSSALTAAAGLRIVCEPSAAAVAAYRATLPAFEQLQTAVLKWSA